MKNDAAMPDSMRYLFAALLGAIGGGIIVAWATQAVPKVMARMFAGIMQTMMGNMAEGDCNPAEI